MIKDGYVNIGGGYIPSMLSGVPGKDEDGNAVNFVAKPCPYCGHGDQELEINDIYRPAGYRLVCEKCHRGVDPALEDYAYFHDDGLIAAIKSWNLMCDTKALEDAGELLLPEGFESPEESFANVPEGYMRSHGKLIDLKTGNIKEE